MPRNLLKNPCGEEQMEFWELTANGGDGWQVEKMPGACGHPFADNSITQYFATSYQVCLKKQVVDLVSEGYCPEDLDTQPAVTVEDWYSGRTDCGCMYQLTVCLLNENKKLLKKFDLNVTVEPFTSSWKRVTHTFSKYGKGMRFISFEHGGHDTRYWKGWYGVRVTDTAIKVHLCSA